MSEIPLFLKRKREMEAKAKAKAEAEIKAEVKRSKVSETEDLESILKRKPVEYTSKPPEYGNYIRIDDVRGGPRFYLLDGWSSAEMKKLLGFLMKRGGGKYCLHCSRKRVGAAKRKRRSRGSAAKVKAKAKRRTDASKRSVRRMRRKTKRRSRKR